MNLLSSVNATGQSQAHSKILEKLSSFLYSPDCPLSVCVMFDAIIGDCGSQVMYHSPW